MYSLHLLFKIQLPSFIKIYSFISFSPLLAKLNCLQKNFPCNRGRPICKYISIDYYTHAVDSNSLLTCPFANVLVRKPFLNILSYMPLFLKWKLPWRADSSFGINSGGPEITSSDRILYEKDSENLGPATHFVVGSDRWAESNVGTFLDSNNASSFLSFSSSQFPNTLDTELFQTSRLSASSLRYYGLGLENGNYTVKLQFAEISIESSRRWQGLGRRVFDIYIQVFFTYIFYVYFFTSIFIC